tara:strand:- start:1813 stop:3096 length:1284 start_codon:yes stop_codon:yes gene_type:complete
MDQSIYRDGKVLTRNAFHKVLSKTLGTTGEHDVWAGSAATMPQPNGTTSLSITSASLQDAALVRDTWTAVDGAGSDGMIAVGIGGEIYGAVSSPTGLDDLADAINDGSKETWAIQVSVLPSVSQGLTTTINAVPYAWLRTTEATIDQAADAIVLALAGNPIYDVGAYGGGSGALWLAAKTRAVNTANPSISQTGNGTFLLTQLVTANTGSTTHTAAESGGTLTITRDTIGVASTITEESDNITLTHAVTGGAGSGVRSLRVTYLDSDDLVRSEVLTLTGTTAALTTYDVVKLLDIVAHASGLTGAAGTITITDGVPTTIATIAAGDSEIKRLAYSVPTAGNPPGSWHLVNLQATVTSAAASILRVRVTGPRGPWLAYQANLPASTTSVPEIEEPIRIVAGETLRVTVEGNGSTTIVSMLGYGEGVSA